MLNIFTFNAKLLNNFKNNLFCIQYPKLEAPILANICNRVLIYRKQTPCHVDWVEYFRWWIKIDSIYIAVPWFTVLARLRVQFHRLETIFDLGWIQTELFVATRKCNSTLNLLISTTLIYNIFLTISNTIWYRYISPPPSYSMVQHSLPIWNL